MRILYDHQVFSLQDAGGASRYHFELARYLGSVPDVQVELSLGFYRSVCRFEDLASPHLRVRGLRAPIPPGLPRYAVNEAIGTAASAFAARFDIYHPTYFRSMPAIRSRRMVVTHHDCVYEEFPRLFRDAAAVIRSKGKLYARADRIICISEASRRGLLAYYPVDAAKTQVVHHGLTALPRSPKAAQELRAHVRRPFLLYVGIRNYHKNFLGFLQAFHGARLHEDYDVLALGGGPLSAKETAAIASLAVSDSVVAIPSVTDELLAEAYVAAALFVYPSLSEGFGIPPLEAMAAGCPVAVSNVTAIPEVCRRRAVLLRSNPRWLDHTRIAQRLNDAEARTRSIARGREVAAGYSWDKCGAETLEVYRACL